jgi:GTP-binding protein Era
MTDRGSPKRARKAKHRSGFVSILGRPNAGKSTLLNALLGTKIAIVASRPQTTRTAIRGVLTLPEAQIVFVDTPGIHKSTTLLNKRMMDTVRSSAEADVVLLLVDATRPFTEEDSQAVDLVKKTGAPSIVVFNKIDALADKPKILTLVDQYKALHDFAAFIPISARRGEGLDILKQEIIERLPQGESLYPADYMTDQPERFMVAELLREQILRLTRDEIPHAVAVVVDTFEDSPKLVRIAASIYVEREGQKAIMVGAGGSLLKQVGTLARREIEKLLGKKVFLQTFVKVHPKWREDPEFLEASDWRGMAGE